MVDELVEVNSSEAGIDVMGFLLTDIQDYGCHLGARELKPSLLNVIHTDDEALDSLFCAPSNQHVLIF